MLTGRQRGSQFVCEARQKEFDFITPDTVTFFRIFKATPISTTGE